MNMTDTEEAEKAYTDIPFRVPDVYGIGVKCMYCAKNFRAVVWDGVMHVECRRCGKLTRIRKRIFDD